MNIIRTSVAALACALLVFAAPLAVQAQTSPTSAQIVQNGQISTLLAITAQTRMAARAMGLGGVGHYAVLPGSRAMLRLTSSQPTFIVAAPNNIQPQGLFTIARFEPRRNGTREVLIGGGYMSYSSGIHPDRVVPVNMVQAPDQRGAPAGTILYQLTPVTPLSSGEYALIVSVAPPTTGGVFNAPSTSGVFYDFGVD
ncbi:MAG: hypothetical protein K2X34_01255 [Hyphomonadaceae bacterium]|nr:hypothetical protein [Hyphomonadaceae bacterium]